MRRIIKCEGIINIDVNGVSKTSVFPCDTVIISDYRKNITKIKYIPGLYEKLNKKYFI